MQHKCKLTVIDKKLYSDLQEKYIADPNAGACPFYHVGDEFIFERYDKIDDFWTMGKGSQCSEAWDCISRYIYSALQGGSIMRGWTNDEKIMIACCNDGTRPVIFKIERIDYKVVHFDRELNDGEKESIIQKITEIKNVNDVKFHSDGFLEIYVEYDIDDNLIEEKFFDCEFKISRID